MIDGRWQIFGEIQVLQRELVSIYLDVVPFE